MFDFQQYIGFLIFAVILLMGFWLLLFLAGFAFYWITGQSLEMLKEKRAAKKAQKE
ncbi:MAG TPA: hypothetical protein VLZ11_09360 [Flavobacterium sp.]|nr:hypothetical protein [Flavobacterium sp.]